MLKMAKNEYIFNDLGFSLVHTKPDRLSQLYYVRCSNNDVGKYIYILLC